jgi:hypothetical protein
MFTVFMVHEFKKLWIFIFETEKFRCDCLEILRSMDNTLYIFNVQLCLWIGKTQEIYSL